MPQSQFKYGIYLGIDRATISCLENGVPHVIKSDTLKDFVPCYIYLNRRGAILIGQLAYNAYKYDKCQRYRNRRFNDNCACPGFVSRLGTNYLYHLSDKLYTPTELTVLLLKHLRLIANDSFNAAIITVPAKFTVNQKMATIEAAKLAGIESCELLQEPIAASVAYDLSCEQKNATWMVFDFAERSFEVAIVKVEDDKMRVFDYEGSNDLGSKSLVEAIVDKIIIPYLKSDYSIDGILSDKDKNEDFREALSSYAEEAKKQLSFKESEDIISNFGDLGEDEDGEELALDLTLTQSQVFEVMRPYFQKAVDICKKLLEKNNLSGDQLSKLILVGASTHSPLIRQMLREQITPNVDTSIDPITAVPIGAALYTQVLNNNKITFNNSNKMARLKIDYGIDLGTTNSAICRMEQGEPVIKKTDTLKDTMPSCISATRRGAIKAGDSAYNDMKSDKRRASKSWRGEASNTYVEFKRTMGTDKVYHSSNLNRDLTSEELSAEVLKALKSFITDENVNSVVITVPAKFTVNQKTATMEAAKLAGFDHCELLQEPIAASMAYGLSSSQKDGIWMVFDFGGGTFDAALIKVEDGIMQVFDTEGDNYLGGKNLDEAIVDKLIIPYLQANFNIDDILSDKDKNEVLREAVKTYAEEAKNQLSFKESEDIISNLGDLGEDEDGEELELDLTLTQSQVFEVMRPYFQKAVDICKKLLEKNNLSGDQLSKLILVGGPTHSPLIRQMLREQITPNVDTSIDPMTAVATGAALFASTIDAQVKEEDISQDVIRLDMGYEATTVESTEWVSVKLPNDSNESIMVELVRGDKAWSSGKTEINAMGNVIEVQLIDGKPNSFLVVAYDQRGNQLPCFPNEITIIQGSKVGSAVLPYFFAVAFWNADKKIAALKPFKGLEKNKPIPAVGVRNDLKTSSQLRPGNSSDFIRIPVYQSTSEVKEDGKKPSALQEYVTNVEITGEEVNALIPEGSNVEITLKVDRSEMMKMEVYFPSCDLTIERELFTGKKQSLEEAEEYVSNELQSAQWKIDELMKEGQDVSALQAQLDLVKDEKKSSTDPRRIMEHLKEVLREIDDLDEQAEWPRIEKRLRRILEEAERDQEKYGTAETANILKQLKANANQVIASKDENSAKTITDQLRALDYKLALVEYFVTWILDWDENFDSIAWRNPTRARQLVNKGMELIGNSASADQLRPVVRELISLIPERSRPKNAGGLLED